MARGRGHPKLIHSLPPLLDYEIEKIKQLTAAGMPVEVISRIYGVPEKQLRKVGAVTTRVVKRYPHVTEEDRWEIYRLSYLMRHKDLAAKKNLPYRFVRAIVERMRKREALECQTTPSP